MIATLATSTHEVKTVNFAAFGSGVNGRIASGIYINRQISPPGKTNRL